MKSRFHGLAVTGPAIAALALLAGCGAGDVAVVDLARVARDTGADRRIEAEVAAGRAELAARVGAIAGNLEQQLAEAEKRAGGPRAAASSEDFQRRAATARDEFGRSRLLAERKAREREAALVAAFRDAVRPVAGRIARDLGAEVVLLAEPGVLWSDPSADITERVVEALRRNPEGLQLVEPAPAAGATGSR